METNNFRQSRWILFQGLLPDKYQILNSGIKLQIRRWFKPMDQTIVIQYKNIAAIEIGKSGKFGLRGWLLNYGHVTIRTNSEVYYLKVVSNYKKFEQVVSNNIENLKSGISDDSDFDLM